MYIYYFIPSPSDDDGDGWLEEVVKRVYDEEWTRETS